MNINENLILSKISERRGNALNVSPDDEILYRRNGRFTIALVHTHDGEIVAVGATKRHPRDKDIPSLAQQIAFARAVRDKGE